MSTCAPSHPTPLRVHPYFAAALLIAAMLVSDAVLDRADPPFAARLALGLLPAAAAAYLVWTMVRYVRGLDELQRKIQAEALALAYTLVIVAAVAASHLHKAGVALPLEWEDGWGLLVFLYAVSYAVMARRYQ
jgi:hypothetical protein